MSREYNRGYRAAIEGRGPESNPYNLEDPRFEEWDRGHLDGEIAKDFSPTTRRLFEEFCNQTLAGE